MQKRPASPDAIVAMRDAADVTGLLEAYEATKRRDTRGVIRSALAACDEDRTVLLDLLDDERWQRSAGGMLVELDEAALPRVAAQLASDDDRRRRGALHTVYLYARYHDLPAAHALLSAVAAGERDADLAEPAERMRAKVQQMGDLRTAEIDKHLQRIAASLERETKDGGNTVSRMFSQVHRARMEARLTITSMRYAAVRHLIMALPEYGEPAVGCLIALGMDELRGDIVPILVASLHTDSAKRRSLLLCTLICLRRARVPGAAEALESYDVEIGEKLDRRAASIYTRWVREG